MTDRVNDRVNDRVTLTTLADRLNFLTDWLFLAEKTDYYETVKEVQSTLRKLAKEGEGTQKHIKALKEKLLEMLEMMNDSGIHRSHTDLFDDTVALLCGLEDPSPDQQALQQRIEELEEALGEKARYAQEQFRETHEAFYSAERAAYADAAQMVRALLTNPEASDATH